MSELVNVQVPEMDLTACDEEPIHIPGCVQPHGGLFVLKEPQLEILQVSNNTSSFLGISPQDLIGKTLDVFLDGAQVNCLKDSLSPAGLPSVSPIKLSVSLTDRQLNFDGAVHRNDDGTVILEIEPSLSKENLSFANLYHSIKSSIYTLKAAANLDSLCQVIVKEVRKLTGFDRVMLYRFDPGEGHGTVIAEDKLESLNPYLGLRYPASDIPKQARRLYCLNWIRLIPDIAYQPVEIVPANNPISNLPIDLSYSFLRSVSPIHIEYLQNMGVSASMSVSLIKDNKLWGLIACHHQSPKYVPYEVRTACEFIGQVMSLEIASKEESEDADYRIEAKSILAKFLEVMSAEENFITGAVKHQHILLNLVSAGGAAVYFDGECALAGVTPQESEVKHLIEWVNRTDSQDVFYTDSLPSLYPEAEKFKDAACGLLALSISKTQKNYVLWFRPEVLQTVEWGGNPNKLVGVGSDGSDARVRLSPRKSFDLWRETVRLKSFPWKQSEIDAAIEMRNAIISIVLRKADELAKLNVELSRSNSELDSFAYIASHDLKEPLRGIHNYSSFLIEDYADKLDEEGVSKLKTLVRLTQRMENLIDSLLYFSRVGRVDLSVEETDLNKLVSQIIEILKPRIEQAKVDIRIPISLPAIRCDRVRVGEVFNNLITNAIKYSDKPEKWIEIGFLEPQQATDRANPEQAIVFYVSDNGIGIRHKHLDTIFRIFKRLHAPDKYGGGTGAGLTIAKKIVERHGGEIWAESTFGQGSTFYFTLQSGIISRSQ
ncbi:ATP-binding protein [Kamptonema formosum]|uniref:ATP-binding protein n=1 Tax=Kamptonema formosum TaxID=331992 RepID=UPI00036A51F0|nr:ATP-binding protein [Oscillatoria sp. PCC 10802]